MNTVSIRASEPGTLVIEFDTVIHGTMLSVYCTSGKMPLARRLFCTSEDSQRYGIILDSLGLQGDTEKGSISWLPRRHPEPSQGSLGDP